MTKKEFYVVAQETRVIRYLVTAASEEEAQEIVEEADGEDNDAVEIIHSSVEDGSWVVLFVEAAEEPHSTLLPTESEKDVAISPDGNQPQETLDPRGPAGP
jgi:hypothetical protein